MEREKKKKKKKEKDGVKERKSAVFSLRFLSSD